MFQCHFLAAAQIDKFAQIDYAHHIVDIVVIYGQAAVRAAGDLLGNLFPAVVEIDTDNFIARHHNIVHGDLFQIQDIQQHGLMFTGNQATGLIDHGAQFVSAEVMVIRFLGRQIQQPQQAIGQYIDHPYRPHQRAVGV